MAQDLRVGISPSDNQNKLILDALTDIAYKDDGQVSPAPGSGPINPAKF
jgi:hypothetical protein